MDPKPEQDVPVRVSAVLVSNNNAAAIRQALEALEASTARPSLEILLVDQGSRDECSRLDEEFPALHLHRLPRHFGMVKALNIAMRTARGDYFLLMEPPALLAPDAIDKLVTHLDSDPSAVAVCPLCLGPGGETVTRLHPLPLPSELFGACRRGDFAGWTRPAADGGPQEVDYIHPPLMMVRASFLRGLRFLDERYGHHWWDLEICTQIRRPGRKILLAPEVQARISQAWQAGPVDSGARAALTADRFLSAAVWVGKHYGFWQGLKFRLRSLLVCKLLALGGMLTFRDVGYRLAVFGYLLSGQKIDGSQRAL